MNTLNCNNVYHGKRGPWLLTEWMSWGKTHPTGENKISGTVLVKNPWTHRRWGWTSEGELLLLPLFPLLPLPLPLPLPILLLIITIIIIILTIKNSTKLPSNISPRIILVQFSDHIGKVSLADNTKTHNWLK